MPRDTDSKSAQLYRMVMPGHVCPYGLKSKDLLERQGFEVEDHPLDTREDSKRCLSGTLSAPARTAR